jgi:translation initiation factor 5
MEFRSDTTKFFGCELGATTILDEKADRWIVNGAHDANRMRELLDGFIDKFVLCGECKNPETVLSITKNQDILRDCKACGATTMVDMRHKLTQFILKNPPKKTGKRKPSDGPKRKDTGSGENTAADDDDDEIAKRLLQEAAELPNAEKSTIAKEEWSDGTTTEAVQKRVAELAIQDGSDLEGGSDNPYEGLTLWIETTRDSITAASLLEKVTQLDIKERHKTVQVISQSLFTDQVLTGEEIEKFLPALREVSHRDVHSDRVSDRPSSWSCPRARMRSKRRRSTKKRSLEGWKGSLVSTTRHSPLRSPRSSWSCTKPISSLRM